MYRSVLEVLKWTAYEDLCDQLTLVSRLWLKAASCDEVWDTLSQVYGFDSSETHLSSKVSFLTQFHLSTLYVIHKNCLQGYSLRTQHWVPALQLKPAIPFDKLSSIVVYFHHVVVTGTSNPVSPQSALIHTTTGEITLLPDMRTARYRHGSLLYKATVYVFAGSGANERVTNQAEKLHLTVPKQWISLPPLLCDLAFSSPCRKGQFAYLFGGWGTSKCQRFDLIAELFAFLPFETPVFGYLTTAVLHQGYIIFCQSGNMVRWSGKLENPPIIDTFREVIGSNW